MKKRELIISGIIVVCLLLCRFVLPKPIQFSPTVSVIIMILMALVFVYVLFRTVQGRLIERRIVFLFVGVALLVPFFMQFALPLPVSPEVQEVYDALEQLEPGAKVLASFDFDPPSAPELQPMANAFMKYAFEKDLKVIIMGLWPQGPQQANQAVEAAFADAPALRDRVQYGRDYVNLGYQAGNEFVILRMGQKFKAMFPSDLYNTPYDSIPLLKNVTNFSNIDFSLNFSAGRPGTQEWVQFAADRFGLKMGAGNTAVQAPMIYPFLNTGQLTGLMGGMTGAAEFELLVSKPDKATTYLLSQSFAHVVVILFIIIGNVAFLRERIDQREKE
jgi:hypothetical protein